MPPDTDPEARAAITKDRAQRAAGRPSLPGPNEKQAPRVAQDEANHAQEITVLRRTFMTKPLCNCPGHIDDPRWRVVCYTGPCAIPRCASKCPFCKYAPGRKDNDGDEDKWVGYGGTIRKHVQKQHAGKECFYGLYVVSEKEARPYFDWLESYTVSDTEEEESEDEEQEAKEQLIKEESEGEGEGEEQEVEEPLIKEEAEAEEAEVEIPLIKKEGEGDETLFVPW